MMEIIANQNFTSLQDLVVNAKARAATGLYDGTKETFDYLIACRSFFVPAGAKVIFTRDQGHHSCGWWKNPDYERCFHLSLSFDEGYLSRRAESLAKAFFGDDTRLLWIEPPQTPQGKALEVWHYRLFCDPAWKGILPTGEVYSRRMPKGWMSFSEKHGRRKGSRS